MASPDTSGNRQPPSLEERLQQCRKIEEELRRSQEQLKRETANTWKFMAAAEASSIPTIITTTEPKILYVNPAWEKLTGYTEQEVMGQNPRLSQSGKTPSEEYARLWQTIRQGQQFQSDKIINRRKDGSEYNAELRVYPVKEGDDIRYFVGHELDITFRLRAERAKTEFIALASHQLQNPLTGLTWGLEMLQETRPLTAEQQNLLATIQKASSQMGESIAVMLRITRLEEGDVPMRRESVLLETLFQELQREFHAGLEARHQTFTIICDTRLPLSSDVTMLREILANLLSNAIKYTPEQGTITLRAAQEGEQIRITVTDNGWGIPADQQDRLFTKFFRATNAVEKVPNGTGLGLYLVRTLTNILGGEITCASTENTGTTFTLIFPRSLQR